MNKQLRLLLVFTFMVSLSSAISLAAENDARVNVSLLSYSPAPVQPGQVMDVVLQLSNLGTATESASLEIINDYPFTVEKSQDLEEAKNLGRVGFTRKLLFRIRVAGDAKDGLTPLRIKYKDNIFDSRGYIEKIFDINVKTFDAKINVVKVEQFPVKIEPGSKGKVFLALQSADDRPLKNIDLNLDLTQSYDANSNMDNTLAMQSLVNARLEEVNRRVASGLSPLKGASPMMSGAMSQGSAEFEFKAFSPVDSSNVKYIKELKAGDMDIIEFDIMALPDSAPDVYATPLYITYNDEDNNPFYLRVDIPLIIDSEPEIYVEMKSTTLRTTDFSADIVFTVANRGLSNLRYVTLELEEDETITLLTAPKNIYIGDLGPGESKEGTFKIIAEDRNINIPLKTEYRDSFNQPHLEVKNIPFTIINKNYYRDLPYEMWIAWIILGLVILVLTIFYVRQMSKRD